ncbi:RNA polymerase sigma factor [Elioraea sp.]|uniref:RNA polymerase sigma factor n=1 Tax=Elioraea sp. TaxID=2185103 RepID=UPI003F6F5CD4
MAAAQGGDRRAYDRLLREILPLLRTVARRRLRNDSDVEDAVQDTLLTIHQIRHTFDPSRPLRPWLSAIADRRALDRVRQVARRGSREEELTDLHHETLVGAATNEGEGRLQARDVRAAVSELSPKQREAIELLKLRELSVAEASARTGQSASALKVATHRAIIALRKRIVGD